MDQNFHYSDDDGRHWRGFALHAQSGIVCILEYRFLLDVPGMPVELTRVLGPFHDSEVSRETLVQAPMADSEPDDVAWAARKLWIDIPLPDGAASP